MTGLAPVNLIKISNELSELVGWLQWDPHDDPDGRQQRINVCGQRLLAMIPDPVFLADCGAIGHQFLQSALDALHGVFVSTRGMDGLAAAIETREAKSPRTTYWTLAVVDGGGTEKLAAAVSSVAHGLVQCAAREPSTQAEASRLLTMGREWREAWAARLEGNPEKLAQWTEQYGGDDDAARETDSKAGESVEDVPQMVILEQCAAIVQRSKRTLEKYKGKGMPEPAVKGGHGQPAEFEWLEMRPWLETTFGRNLPERHPAIRPLNAG